MVAFEKLALIRLTAKLRLPANPALLRNASGIRVARVKSRFRNATLYFDSTARNGAVDDIPSSFPPDLFNKLKKVIDSLIEMDITGATSITDSLPRKTSP